MTVRLLCRLSVIFGLLSHLFSLTSCSEDAELCDTFYTSFNPQDQYMDFSAEGGEITIYEAPSYKGVPGFYINYITKVAPLPTSLPNPNDPLSIYYNDLHFDATPFTDDKSTMTVRSSLDAQTIQYEYATITTVPGSYLNVKLPANDTGVKRVFYMINFAPMQKLNAVRVTQEATEE